MDKEKTTGAADIPKELRAASNALKEAAAHPKELTPFNVYGYPVPDNPTAEQITAAQIALNNTPDWLTVNVITKKQPGPDPETGALSSDHPVMTAKKEVHVNAQALARQLIDSARFEHFPALMEGAVYEPTLGTWRTFGKGEWKLTINALTHKELKAWGCAGNKRAIGDVFDYINLDTYNQTYRKHSPFDDPAHPELVAFANGTYNIKTGKLEESSPSNYILNAHAYNVDPDNYDCPATERLLKSMLGPAVVTFEQFIGYMFYRSHAPFQEFLWLSGSGGEGKSTLLKRVVMPLLGADNYATENPQDLSDPAKRFNTANLYGKEANIVADVPENYMKDTSMIKRLTGGDVISAEFKGIQNFNFTNYGKQLYAANSMPAFSDISTGFTRRALVIRLINGDTNHNRDWWQRNADWPAIERERPAFAMRCLRAFSEALAAGKFTKPPEVVKASQDWIDANDHLGEFISEGFLVKIGDESYFVKAPDFHRTFAAWCSANGYSDKTSAAKIRGRMMLKKFPQVSKHLRNESPSAYYVGLKSNGTFG